MADIFDTPKHDDLIFDVGLHTGQDTEFYLRKGFRVVAFDADPDLVRECRERFASYIADERLVIVEGAIVVSDTGDIPRTLTFYKNEGNSQWGTTSPDWVKRNERKGKPSQAVEVETIDFIAALRQYGIPHYLKIDIEGMDMMCVHALERFRERPDYVSIESDKTSFERIASEIETLSALGYDAFQAVEQSEIPERQLAPKPAREGTYVDFPFPFGTSGLFGAELGGTWSSARAILRRYRFIRLGYYLVGDEGLLIRHRFFGARKLRALTRFVLRPLTGGVVPGWYDTHARHRSVTTRS
jgi:FkbM family methyltransferase